MVEQATYKNIEPFRPDYELKFVYKGTNMCSWINADRVNKCLTLAKRFINESSLDNTLFINYLDTIENGIHILGFETMTAVDELYELDELGDLPELGELGDIKVCIVNILYLLMTGDLNNDDMNGYMTKRTTPDCIIIDTNGGNIALIHDSVGDASEFKQPTPTTYYKKKAVKVTRVINAPIEIDRTPVDFSSSDKILLLEKAELIVLGNRLGLTGLTKLNKVELIKRCRTRRSNSHFDDYVNEAIKV